METRGVLEALLQGIDAEALTPAALQEYLHKLEVRKEEVLLTLYASVAERFASADDEEPESEEAAALQDELAITAVLASLKPPEAEPPAEPSATALHSSASQAGPPAELLALAARHAALCGELAGVGAALGAARVAAELQQRLADLDAQAQQGKLAVCGSNPAQEPAAALAAAPGPPQPPPTAPLHRAAGSYAEAAWTVVELRKAVTAVPGHEDAAAAVEARAEALAALLLELAAGLATADPGTHVLQPVQLPRSAAPAAPPASGGEAASSAGTADASFVTAGSAPGSAAGGTAEEVWEALGVLGLLPDALRALAATALRASFGPLLAAAAGGGASGITSGPSSPGASVASSGASGWAPAAAGAGHLERALYKSMKVLAEQVLGGNPERIGELGSALWPDLAAAYVEARLRPALPQGESSAAGAMEAFLRAGSLGVKLEAKALKLGLLPAGREGPVGRFVRCAANRFLNAKRNRFIAAARDLLTSASATDTLTVGVPPRLPADGADGAGPNELAGEPPVLATCEYVVSRGAEGAVNLMHDAMAEACRSGNSALAQAMCGAVVDVAALLCALPPFPADAHAAAGGEGGGEAAALLPFPAAVRHNDCLHVHQALCGLPYQYAPRLQALVHRSVNFVAPAQRVRRAGDAALGAMVGHQREELLRLAAGFNSFSGLEHGQALIHCGRVAAQLLAGLRRLGGVLRGVLAPGIHAEVAAELVQPLAAAICADILSLSDISVEESEQIPQILGELLDHAGDAALPPPPADADVGVAAAHRAARRLFDERTPALAKLREMVELLGADLKGIWRRWIEGRLQKLGFSAREVSHLVAALFEGTQPRKDFLAVLRAAEREGK